ncbi:hypothetical protein V6Z11_1Z011400 [Gossypium hirsutum]
MKWQLANSFNQPKQIPSLSLLLSVGSFSHNALNFGGTFKPWNLCWFDFNKTKRRNPWHILTVCMAWRNRSWSMARVEESVAEASRVSAENSIGILGLGYFGLFRLVGLSLII